MSLGNGGHQPCTELDQIFHGINVAGSGYGPVGTVFNGVPQVAGMHMRASTQFRSNLANGNYMVRFNF